MWWRGYRLSSQGVESCHMQEFFFPIVQPGSSANPFSSSMGAYRAAESGFGPQWESFFGPPTPVRVHRLKMYPLGRDSVPEWLRAWYQTVNLYRLPPPPRSRRHWVPVFFHGGKVAGGDVEHWPLSSAEVKNEWNYTSAHAHRNGLVFSHRDKCTGSL